MRLRGLCLRDILQLVQRAESSCLSPACKALPASQQAQSLPVPAEQRRWFAEQSGSTGASERATGARASKGAAVRQLSSSAQASSAAGADAGPGPSPAAGSEATLRGDGGDKGSSAAAPGASTAGLRAGAARGLATSALESERGSHAEAGPRGRTGPNTAAVGAGLSDEEEISDGEDEEEEEEEGSGEEGWAGSDAEDASDYEEGDGSGLPQYYGMSFEELQEDSELEYLSESDAPGTWAEQDKDGAVAEELAAMSLDIPEGMPVHDMQTDFPWAYENTAQGTEMLSRVLKERPDMAQLLDVMPLVPPHPGALPILNWETHLVLAAGPDDWVHPASRKAKLWVNLTDLQAETHLSDAAVQHIALVCGPRYNHNTGCITLTTERHAHREDNRREVLRWLHLLIAEGHRAYPAEPRPELGLAWAPDGRRINIQPLVDPDEVLGSNEEDGSEAEYGSEAVYASDAEYASEAEHASEAEFDSDAEHTQSGVGEREGAEEGPEAFEGGHLGDSAPGGEAASERHAGAEAQAEEEADGDAASGEGAAQSRADAGSESDAAAHAEGSAADGDAGTFPESDQKPKDRLAGDASPDRAHNMPIT